MTSNGCVNGRAVDDDGHDEIHVISAILTFDFSCFRA